MKLFIRIENNVTVEHPIVEDNFIQAFPEIDINNLPANFAIFHRVEKPNKCKIFEVEECSYYFDGSVAKDVWSTRAMTEQEKQEKIKVLSTMFSEEVKGLKERAKFFIEQTKFEETKVALLKYIQKLDSWVLTDVENPNIPSPPMINNDGSLVNLNSAGSEPNVIG